MKVDLYFKWLKQALRLFLCLLFLQTSSAWAQATAAVNMAGSTTKAAVIVAANGGTVGTADAGELMQRFVMQRVAMEEGPKFKALAASGPLQALYSKLVPFTARGGKPITGFIKRTNTETLEQIATAYKNVPASGLGALIVDVLPILVRGEKGFDAKVSLAFATFVAKELVRQGVKNVRLNHVPVGPTTDGQSGETPTMPDTKPATKS
jgi:hypothetical protein